MSANLVLPMPLWASAGMLIALVALVGVSLQRLRLSLPHPVLAAPLLAALGVLALVLAYWVCTRRALRARVFAPVHGGSNWEPLMRAVHARVKSEVCAQPPFLGVAAPLAFRAAIRNT